MMGRAVRVWLSPRQVWKPKSRAAREQARKVACGARHAVLLTAGGGVLTWGSGSQGQLGRVEAYHQDRWGLSASLRGQGMPGGCGAGTALLHTVLFGAGSCSKLFGGTPQTYPDERHACVGALVSRVTRSEAQPSGDVLFAPTAVSGLDDLLEGGRVEEVACGAYSTFAVSEDGHVAAWGLNNSGQLGLAKVDDNDNIKWVALSSRSRMTRTR